MTDLQRIPTDSHVCSNLPEVVPAAVCFMGALLFVPLRMPSVWVRWSQQTCVAGTVILNGVKYFADVALEPVSPCEVYGASGTALKKTASQLHGEVLQPDSNTVHFPDSLTSSENMSNKEWHGVVKWRYNERFRAWCLLLGMSASSWDGWAKLHANPCVAICYFFPSVILESITAGYSCTGVRGEGHMYFAVLVPLACHTVVVIAVTICFWRWGPAVAHHKLYLPVLAFLALCTTPMCYVAFLGPEETVPWNNSFHNLAIVCFGLFWLLQAASAGLVPGEHPAEPRTSINGPVIRCALQALLLFDAFSDLALTRSLLAAVCSH